jgi:hypothetical protein
MQIKLHRWAGEDSSRWFGDLFNLVYDPAFLVHAWERVAANAGARTPGVDRATVASSVAVTRYRYRGANIPTPWTQPAAAMTPDAADQRPRHVERPVP